MDENTFIKFEEGTYNTRLDLAEFLGVNAAEFSKFWETLTLEEKFYFRVADLQ